MITKYIIFALVLDGLIRNKDSEKWEKMKNIFIFKITTSKKEFGFLIRIPLKFENIKKYNIIINKIL